MYLFICVYTHHLYTYKCVYISLYICIYIYMHTYIHTYTYTQHIASGQDVIGGGSGNRCHFLSVFRSTYIYIYIRGIYQAG